MAKKDSPVSPKKVQVKKDQTAERLFRKGITLGFPIRGKNAKSKISYPTDAQWRDWQIELAPSVDEGTGDIALQWERASHSLYRKIKIEELGDDQIEAEDRESVISRLAFCEAVSTDMNASTVTVELALFNSDPNHPTHFMTIHTLRMPNEREIRDYRKGKLTENSRGGRRRIVTHPEVTAGFYDTMLKEWVGYESIADISLLHKLRVVDALEDAVTEFDRKEQVEIDFT